MKGGWHDLLMVAAVGINSQSFCIPNPLSPPLALTLALPLALTFLGHLVPINMSSPLDFTDKTPHSQVIDEPDEDDLPSKVAAERRIRYLDDDDLEAQEGPRRTTAQSNDVLRRRSSSFSIHSVQSIQRGDRVRDPAAALPIAYRTVSFNISNSQERAAFEAKEKKREAEESRYIPTTSLI